MKWLREVDELPPWALALVAAVAALALYLPTATWGPNHINDVRATTLAAWTLAERGTFDVPAQALERIPWVEVVDGEQRIHRTPGPVLWATLFYLAGDYEGERTISGIRDVPFGPATASAVAATAIGVACMTALSRRLVEGRIALASGLLLALGTGNWAVSANGAWTHGITLMGLSAGMLALSRDRFGRTGVAMGISVLARPQTVVAPFIVGIWSGLAGRRIRPVVLVGVTSAVGAVGVLAWYVGLFGQVLPRAAFVESVATGTVATGGAQGLGGLVEWMGAVALWLVSPQTGLFVYSPFIVVLLPGLRAAWNDAPEWVRSSAVAALVYLVVQSRGNVWDGGGMYFGYRLPLEVLTLAWPLLLLSYARCVAPRPRVRTAFNVLAMVSVLVFAAGVTFLRPDPLSLLPTP